MIQHHQDDGYAFPQGIMGGGLLQPSGGHRKIWYASLNTFEFEQQVSRSLELLGVSPGVLMKLGISLPYERLLSNGRILREPAIPLQIASSLC
jgi:hypothetical protein